jgi:hypothetical protein
MKKPQHVYQRTKTSLFSLVTFHRLIGLSVLLLMLPAVSWADQATNENVKITLPDGSVYTGGLKDGLFHGHGVRLFPNGDKYEGDYEAGQANGQGVGILHSGDRYEGQFKHGRYNGTGCYIHVNKYRYEGEFKDGDFEGVGDYSSTTGYKAHGQFKAGELNGIGTCVYANGTKASGEFENGTLNGSGEVRYASGRKEKGQFKNGYLHGPGVVWTSSGRKYEGVFKNGKLEDESTSAGPATDSLWDMLTGSNPKFATAIAGKNQFWLPLLLVISLLFNIMLALKRRPQQNWFQPQLAEKQPPDYSAALNDTERFEKIVVLENEVQAEALDALLAERGIPHEMKSYRDSALDGVYLSSGWGHVSAPKEQAAAVMQALKDLSAPPGPNAPA